MKILSVRSVILPALLLPYAALTATAAEQTMVVSAAPTTISELYSRMIAAQIEVHTQKD